VFVWGEYDLGKKHPKRNTKSRGDNNFTTKYPKSTPPRAPRGENSGKGNREQSPNQGTSQHYRHLPRGRPSGFSEVVCYAYQKLGKACNHSYCEWATWKEIDNNP